jgi:hypothetical protein
MQVTSILNVTRNTIEALPDMQKAFAKYLVSQGEIKIIKEGGPSSPTKAEMDHRTENTKQQIPKAGSV